MENHITLEAVELAYYECRRNKRNTFGALEYELNYEINNYHLYEELNAMTYEIGKSICFCVTRPKLREVFCAQFRDRVVHHIIMQRFLPLIESQMIDDSYNCRKGKGTLYGVNRIQQHIIDVSENYTTDAYVLKCDLQGFFVSIDRDILMGMIERLIRSVDTPNAEWWLWLIRKVVYNRPELNCDKRGDLSLFEQLEPHKSLFHSNGKGLPIGNLTSQIFANFYMTVFDKWLLARLDENERYGRFVDDFVIISRDKRKLLRLIGEMREWLSDSLHVKMHPRKIYLQEVKKGVEFIGTIIKPNRRYTTNRTVDNVFEVVERFNKEQLTLTDFWQKINSYYGFLRHSNSYGIRWRLWKAIKDKSKICCVNMQKIEILTNKNKLVQTDENGILTAEWTQNDKDYELHQINH